MDMTKRKSYTDAQVTDALVSISQGMSVYEASRQYKVPETTLRNKRDQLHNNKNSGKPPVLTLTEEKKIVDWIHYLGRCGFPVAKQQLLLTVGKLVEGLNRPNPFKNGVPGDKWYRCFMSRHPTVAKRVPQNLPSSRNITEEALRQWFERVHNYFENHNFLEILQDASRIFNCDETGFFLCPKERQVLVKKGSKRVYTRVGNDEKECLTVLVNAAADGSLAPPMVLFPYKRLPKSLQASVPPWWGLGHTDSGWMTMQSFYEYIANVFYPWLLKKEINLPVVMFLDGHTSHISLPLTTFCKEKGIILVALLPNATHILQPLDVAVFRAVKGTWRSIVQEFRVAHNYAKLRRADFCTEVQKCFDRSLKPETIKSGFKCCGIYPFNADSINYDKLLTKPQIPEDNAQRPEDKGREQNDTANEQFKIEFESRLCLQTKKMFREAGDKWSGDPSYEQLFLFWKQLSPSVHENEPLEIVEATYNTHSNDSDNDNKSVNDFEIAWDRNSAILHDLDDATQMSPSSNAANQNNSSQTQYILATSASNSPVGNINPIFEEETTPTKKLQLTYKERTTSTPENMKYFSPNVIIINADDNLSLSPSSPHHILPPPNDPLNDVETESRREPLIPSTSKTEIDGDIPTPFQGITTPFKKAFFFPKKDQDIKSRRMAKKMTPTVATAAEFMEYQIRIDKEKEEKERLKLKRKQDNLDKKKQKELNGNTKQKKECTPLYKEKIKDNMVLVENEIQNQTEQKKVNQEKAVLYENDSAQDYILKVPDHIRNAPPRRHSYFFDFDSDSDNSL